jgi:hypothetical protein
MHTPVLLIKYPGYANISEHGRDMPLYAGLADTLIFWPDPTLVNQSQSQP